MNASYRLAIAGITFIASAIMVWPVMRTSSSLSARPFPGLLAEAVAVAIAFSTWALVFTLTIWIVFRVPKSWHVSARAAGIFAVAGILLTAGALALLAAFYLLNLICVGANVCKISAFLETVNHAFTRYVLHSPYPEPVLVVFFVVGVAVALRNLFRFKAPRSGGQHAA